MVLTVAGGKVNAGGLAGVNGWWSKAQIQGSSIDKEVSFVYRGNGEGAIGGLVGWNVQGTITGCYSLMWSGGRKRRTCNRFVCCW